MLGLGFDLAVPVALLGLGGHALDRWWGTAPWVMLAGLLLGMVVGFYNLWRRVVVPRQPPGAPKGSPP
jgi:F0F1-type ATP synthase assembly protein I